MSPKRQVDVIGTIWITYLDQVFQGDLSQKGLDQYKGSVRLGESQRNRNLDGGKTNSQSLEAEQT